MGRGQPGPSTHCVGRIVWVVSNTTFIQSGLNYEGTMLVHVTVKLRFSGFRKGSIQQLSITKDLFLCCLLACPSSMFGDSWGRCNNPNKFYQCSLHGH